jgi:hypothetical protein
MNSKKAPTRDSCKELWAPSPVFDNVGNVFHVRPVQNSWPSGTVPLVTVNVMVTENYSGPCRDGRVGLRASVQLGAVPAVAN